jgi:phospholipid/cholesterol/gamma-HCH transport system ATP-binding protein
MSLPGSIRSAYISDELIFELRNSLGATIVVVTHEPSIFAIGNNSVFSTPIRKR